MTNKKPSALQIIEEALVNIDSVLCECADHCDDRADISDYDGETGSASPNAESMLLASVLSVLGTDIAALRKAVEDIKADNTKLLEILPKLVWNENMEEAKDGLIHMFINGNCATSGQWRGEEQGFVGHDFKKITIGCTKWMPLPDDETQKILREVIDET